jgi:hypothetical protein
VILQTCQSSWDCFKTTVLRAFSSHLGVKFALLVVNVGSFLGLNALASRLEGGTDSFHLNPKFDPKVLKNLASDILEPGSAMCDFFT